MGTLPMYLVHENLQTLNETCLGFIAHPDFPELPVKPGMDAYDYLKAGIQSAIKNVLPGSWHPGVVFEFTEEEPLRLGYHITSDEAEWCSVRSLMEKYQQVDSRIVPSLIKHLQDHTHFCGPLYTPKNAVEHLEMREEWGDLEDLELEVRQRIADERDVPPETIADAEVQSAIDTEHLTSKGVKKKHPEWFVDALTLEALEGMLPDDPLLQEATTLLRKLHGLDLELREASMHGEIELPSLEDWHCHSYVFCITPNDTVGYTDFFYETFEEEMRDWGNGLAPYFVGEVTEQGLKGVLETLCTLEEARKVQHQLLHLLTEDCAWKD